MLGRHQCLIYEGSPSRNLPSLVATIKQKLKENNRCLYLDSPPMVAGMRSYLAAAGVDVVSEMDKATLVLSSAQAHLVGGRFDVEMMIQTLQDAVAQALRDGYDGLWASGDMTWEFGPKNDFSKLLEYEWALEEFIRTHAALSGICLYHGDTLPREALHNGLLTHQCIFVNETLSKINPHFVPQTVGIHGAATVSELDWTLDRLFQSAEIN
jgi:hypothetical protein